MLRCDDVIAELSAFLDDDLALEVRRGIELHLGDCRTCRTIYDSTRKTLLLVTESGSFEVPATLTSRIMAQLRAGRKEPPE